MKKTVIKRYVYQIALFVIALLVVGCLEYLSSLQRPPTVIEYTINNPAPECSHAEVSAEGTPPVIVDRWQTPCVGGYFLLKPYNAIYFNWNDQSYLITDDTASFRVYMQDASRSYAHDSKNVYYRNTHIKGANPNTFTPQ